ncbi:MAG: hypothetical protein ACFHX7_07445 [Pseudomonadota bacterium]
MANPEINRWAGLWLLCLCCLLYAPDLLSTTLVGPFRTQADAELAREALGSTAVIATKVTTEPADYIVVSDRAGPQLGRALLAELARAGIRDVVYVRTGEFGGRVSAGVYVGTESAGRRVRQLADRGFTFQTLPRKMQEVSLGWLTTTDPVSPAQIAAIEQQLGYSLTTEQVAGESNASSPDVDVSLEVPGVQATPREEPAVTQTPVETGQPAPTGVLPETPEILGEDTVAAAQESFPVTEPVPDFTPAPTGDMAAASQQAQRDTPAQSAEPLGTLAPATAPVHDAAPEQHPLDRRLLAGLLLGALVMVVLVLFALSRRRTGKPAGENMDDLPPLQQAAAQATPAPAPAQPDTSTPAPESPQDQALLETLDVSDRRAIDLIGDLVALAQVEHGAGNTLELDALLLAFVNDARTTHAISTIRYRPGSALPKVTANADSLRRLLGILVQQVVSFDDAAHILMTASYTTEPTGQLRVQLVNEAALLTEAELQAVRDTWSHPGTRFAIAGQIAGRMGGHIDLASRFGLGTQLSLALQLPESRQSTGTTDSSHLTAAAAEKTAKEITQEFQFATRTSSTLGETPLPGMQVETRDPVERFVAQLEQQLADIERARASGDLDTLARIAKWTARYAGGTGMTQLAERLNRFHSAMVQGQEIAALAQLTPVYMATRDVQPERPAAAQSNIA